MGFSQARKKQLITFLMSTCILMVSMFTLSAAAEESAGFSSLSDFKGKQISMLTGTSFDVYMEKNEILKGDVDILMQNSTVDSISSVISGKSDAVIMDLPIAEIAVAEHEELAIFPECIQDDAYGFAFPKGSPLVSPFNKALKKLMDDGLEKKMAEKWMGNDEALKVINPPDWEGSKGTLRYWANTGAPPMCYLGSDGTPVGYAVDIVMQVAREMDYKVEITECAFSGLIPSVLSGKADLAGASMSITEERREKVDFSDPFYRGGSFFVVRKDRLALSGETGTAETKEETGNFLASIKNSFYKTFIHENRGNVFLKGFLNTMIITIASMFLGCVFGFALFFLCRKTGKTVLSIVQTVTGIITGIPAVVLLMVLFYVIFGKHDISGIIVSIMAFTLTFGTSVFSMLQVGTGAIDIGQTEGAYALGFSDNETLFTVILPQALMHILPIFKGEAVSLLKSTAIVGYIAVQDLTRAGDMIRSRTFDAFFSLISVAVIYYVVGRLMGMLIGKLQKSLDPKRRNIDRILMGVIRV